MRVKLMSEVNHNSVKTTVAAIITRNNSNFQQVLLTRRGYPPFKGQWCLPGGHIDKFEKAVNAIQREVKEEVGLIFQAHFFKYFDEIIPEENIHAVVLVFDGPTSGELVAQPVEVTDIDWFTFSEAVDKNLAFQHKNIIKSYMDIFSSSEMN
jgi:8-oxo-dGTP diphosphatase